MIRPGRVSRGAADRAGLAGLALTAVLTACSLGAPAPSALPDPPPPPPPPPDIVTVAPPAPEPAIEGGATVISGGSAVPIQLRFTSVSKLHQGFFLRDTGLRSLGKDLGACTDHTVGVDIVWNDKEFEGRLVARIPRQSSTCEPELAPDGLDLQPLTAIARALARYRDDVAGRSDFRIASFKVAVDVVSRGAVCRFSAGGQHPPDGSTFSHCVQVGGEQVCAAPGPDGEGVTALRTGDPRVRAALAKCLGAP